VRDSQRALTFGQWNERASRLANDLLALGLKGDRIALLAYNGVEWMEMYVAAARAGLVAVPINFRLVGPEISYIAQECGVQAFIVQDDLYEQVETVRDQLDMPPEHFIHFGADAAPPRWGFYESIIASVSGTASDMVVQPEDTLALMYTSGTTGKPKGAIRNHGDSALLSVLAALDIRRAKGRASTGEGGVSLATSAHGRSLSSPTRRRRARRPARSCTASGGNVSSTPDPS